MTTLNLTTTQESDLSVNLFRFAGDTAQPLSTVSGIVWGTSDPVLLSVTPSDDSLTAVVKALGPEGAAQVTWQAVTKSGKTLVAVPLDVTVAIAEPTIAIILASAPVEQA